MSKVLRKKIYLHTFYFNHQVLEQKGVSDEVIDYLCLKINLVETAIEKLEKEIHEQEEEILKIEKSKPKTIFNKIKDSLDNSDDASLIIIFGLLLSSGPIGSAFDTKQATLLHFILGALGTGIGIFFTFYVLIRSGSAEKDKIKDKEIEDIKKSIMEKTLKISSFKQILEKGLKNKADYIYDDYLHDLCSGIPPSIEKLTDLANTVQICEGIKIYGKIDDDNLEFGIRGQDNLIRETNLMYLFFYFFENRVCIVQTEIFLLHKEITISTREWIYDQISAINHSDNFFEIRNIIGERIRINTKDVSHIKFDRDCILDNENNIMKLKKIIRENSKTKT